MFYLAIIVVCSLPGSDYNGCFELKDSGAQGRIRTTDTRIFSPLLYQLSYLGTSVLQARY